MGKNFISHMVQNAFILGVAAAVFFGSSGLTILASAFEAHVVNVIAKIEPPPPQCGALSIGYWRNHEGCSGGEGESVWTSEVNDLSARFSDVFASYTGAEICENLWVPNCPKGNTSEAKLCKAQAHTLANELNVVSSRLDLRALLAGADDGMPAFDNLGLAPDTQVQEALVIIERVLANPFATKAELTDAAYIAERLYTFYEDENPIGPQCVYSSAEWAEYQWSQEHQYGESGGQSLTVQNEEEEPPAEETEEGGGEGLVVIQGSGLFAIGSPTSPLGGLGDVDSGSSSPAFDFTSPEEVPLPLDVEALSDTDSGSSSPAFDFTPSEEKEEEEVSLEVETLGEVDSGSSGAAFDLAPEDSS